MVGHWHIPADTDAARVIDGILYSPTHAHSLTRGDLIHMPGIGTARITGMWHDGGCARLALTNERGAGELLVGWNLTVLRGVGCGGSGLL